MFNGQPALACASASRLRLLHAPPRERSAKRGKDDTLPAVDVKDGRHAEKPGDLANGPLVLEPERKEEAVRRLELAERLPERSRQFLPADPSVGTGVGGGRQDIGVDLRDDEILDPPPHGVLRDALLVIAARAAVPLSLVVTNETPSDDDEPGRETRASVRSVSAEPGAPIVAQRSQHEGVGIHRRVPVAQERAANMEQDAAVSSDEVRPGFIRLSAALGFEGCEQALERRRTNRRNGVVARISPRVTAETTIMRAQDGGREFAPSHLGARARGEG